jgi:L-alanine-DL-glutamate epimerase-like enolase superfamily enzyme
VLIVELSDGAAVGRGECHGVYYLDETPDQLQAQIESVVAQLERGVSRQELRRILPPGGARNGLDCALWDFEAKQSGASVWDHLGIAAKPVRTPYTITIAPTAEEMAAAAAKAKNRFLKIKLDGVAPLERLRAIRSARPDAELIVDANQGWSLDQLKEIAPGIAELDVRLVEQPLARGADEGLEGYDCPVRLCADESCQHLGELDLAARRYQAVNIKLDKIGGLTEALQMQAVCAGRGLKTMVGCMLGTSLAMAPAFLLAQLCELADIDAPIYLGRDRPFGLTYQSGVVSPPQSALWG